eukprot:3307334-Karenia_brevis.AAC.1
MLCRHNICSVALVCLSIACHNTIGYKSQDLGCALGHTTKIVLDRKHLSRLHDRKAFGTIMLPRYAGGKQFEHAGRESNDFHWYSYGSHIDDDEDNAILDDD